MSELRELYQQVILDHNKTPRNFGKLECANREQEGYNPLCGDHLHVYLQVDDGGVIEDIRFEGSGCAISKASASLMTDAVKGRSSEEAEAAFSSFQALVLRCGLPGRRGAGRQAGGVRRSARVSHANQVRDPGVAHHEGRSRPTDRACYNGVSE